MALFHASANLSDTPRKYICVILLRDQMSDTLFSDVIKRSVQIHRQHDKRKIVCIVLIRYYFVSSTCVTCVMKGVRYDD